MDLLLVRVHVDLEKTKTKNLKKKLIFGECFVVAKLDLPLGIKWDSIRMYQSFKAEDNRIGEWDAEYHHYTSPTLHRFGA